MKKEIIGDCILYLGNCLEVIEEIIDNSIDLIFTDPPYGHNNNNGDLISRREESLGKIGKYTEKRPIANDGKEANQLFEDFFASSKRVLKKPSTICCCCGGGGPDPQFARWSLYLDSLFKFKQMIVFDKGPMGMGWHYRRSYETILVAEMPGKSRWHDDTGKIENIIRPGQYGIKKIIPSHLDHPTPKPAELAMLFINLHTLPGDIVLDPFMGGGSTAIAALRLQRKFIGIEIEKKWFDLACKRIENESRQGSLF